MKKLFENHYKAIISRGLIKSSTTDLEFLNKAKEELKEWSEDYNPQEAMDTICVLSNWLIHNGHDIESLLTINLKHQQTRHD